MSVDPAGMLKGVSKFGAFGTSRGFVLNYMPRDPFPKGIFVTWCPRKVCLSLGVHLSILVVDLKWKPAGKRR